MADRKEPVRQELGKKNDASGKPQRQRPGPATVDASAATCAMVRAYHPNGGTLATLFSLFAHLLLHLRQSRFQVFVRIPHITCNVLVDLIIINLVAIDSNRGITYDTTIKIVSSQQIQHAQSTPI